MDTRTRAWIRSIREVLDNLATYGLFEDSYPKGVPWTDLVKFHDPTHTPTVEEEVG